MTTEDVVAQLIADFGRIPLGFRQEVRPRLKESADLIVAQAKANASYSQRIPVAIQVSARLSKKRQGFAIRVSRKKAPHARPLEGIGTRGTTFRHPSFGNREVWVEQPERPFVMPAVKQHRTKALDAVARAIEESARKYGWQ